MGSLRERSSFHARCQAEYLSLCALASQVAPHLGVVDGFRGMEGNGPVHGDPLDLRVAVASVDFPTADAVAFRNHPDYTRERRRETPDLVGFLLRWHAGAGPPDQRWLAQDL